MPPALPTYASSDTARLAVILSSSEGSRPDRFSTFGFCLFFAAALLIGRSSHRTIKNLPTQQRVSGLQNSEFGIAPALLDAFLLILLTTIKSSSDK
jgi:hypothetical protein